MENSVKIIPRNDERSTILVTEFPGMVHYVLPESVDFQAQTMGYLKEFLNQPVCIGFHLDLPAGVAQVAAEHINKDILQFLRYPEMKVDNTSIPLMMTVVGKAGFFITVGRLTAAEGGFITFKSPDAKYILEEVPGYVEEAYLTKLDNILLQKTAMEDEGQWIAL